MWWCARRARCLAICTSCGAPAIPRATTSSTATPAWATRWQAASASGWPSPDRDVFVMVGDGSYLMMATELVTAVQEGIKVIVVLVQNHGFASIGSLSEVAGLAAVRHRLPLPQRRRSPRRRQAARRPRRQRRQPGRRRHQGRHGRGVQRRRQGGQGQRSHHRHPRRDRPADPRTGQRILVGRTGKPRSPRWSPRRPPTRPTRSGRRSSAHSSAPPIR